MRAQPTRALTVEQGLQMRVTKIAGRLECISIWHVLSVSLFARSNWRSYIRIKIKTLCFDGEKFILNR
jgi:hypothetical protein